MRYTQHDAIDVLSKTAEGRGVPVAHVAYAWLLAKPAVSSVIIGASRPEQLADNLAAADLLLTEHEVAELDEQAPCPPLYPDPQWLISGR